MNITETGEKLMAEGEEETDAIYSQFMGCFRDALDGRKHQGRRIGAELKFPLVNRDDGTAVEHEMVDKLWQYLADRGWSTVDDDASGKVVGATHPGEHNETVASCETGYCKTEFSLAHVGNLFDLEESLEWLRDELRPFARENEVYFLGYGIQPVTPPGEDLLMQDGRSSVWDSVFGSNRHIPEHRGVDFHLFTINSDNHVHVSVDEEEEAIRTVNVLNGFSGAQIAISAHSNIWRGRIDPDYKCITEKFWDWWMEDANRVGVPEKPFEDPRDYVETIARMKPVYVKRDGEPVVLEGHESFRDYYTSERTRGQDANGNEVELAPHHVLSPSACRTLSVPRTVRRFPARGREDPRREAAAGHLNPAERGQHLEADAPGLPHPPTRRHPGMHTRGGGMADG